MLKPGVDTVTFTVNAESDALLISFGGHVATETDRVI